MVRTSRPFETCVWSLVQPRKRIWCPYCKHTDARYAYAIQSRSTVSVVKERTKKMKRARHVIVNYASYLVRVVFFLLEREIRSIISTRAPLLTERRI